VPTDTVTITLPSGHVESMTPDEWRSVRGSGNQQLSPGGNWKLDVPRCACGAMTLKRAEARGHKCVAKRGRK
jgi:hypothetical protein